MAVLALLDDAHVGRKYELTGPQVLTPEEQVAIIGSVVGKELRVSEQSASEARQAMLAMGADPILAETAVQYWASLVENPEPVTPDFSNLTGKPGRTFRDWAQDHADELRVLSTGEVAAQFVAAFRTGEFRRASQGTPDVVRVAPLEYEGELVGQTAIMENAARSLAGHEIFSVDVVGSLLSADQFAVRFTFHYAGEEPPTTKLSLYTVDSGHIIREEVFYFTPP